MLDTFTPIPYCRLMTNANPLEEPTMKAEDARSPHDPRLSAYEAGRWYALNGRAYPAGASRECIDGYYDVITLLCDTAE